MNLANPQHSLPPLAAAEQFLSRIDVLIDWVALEAVARAATEAEQGSLPLPAIKVALLKQWYGIADNEAVFAILDRLSFRSFVGFIGDGGANDAAILSELDDGFWSRQPAMDELAGAIDEQLRELGYAVRTGQLREPSIAPCTETGDEAPRAGSTTLFRPGELGRMVEAVTAKAHAQGRMPTGPQARQDEAAEDSSAAAGSGQTVQQADPIRAVLEWPWGHKSELSEHLYIGRDYAFSPLARELTPYTHVSRKHAELLVYGDGVWVRDLGSRNGTYVNDDEVPKGQAYLIDADSIIRFGPLLAVSLKVVD